MRMFVCRPLAKLVGGLRGYPASKTNLISGLDSLYNDIKLTGPMTVANYMKQCLLHPVFGYYMQGDVFGARGDFITSPEISQVFGELLAVWVLADWKSRGEITPIQLVELGPGRGTLLKDMLRVFRHKQLSSILENLSIHLVEASSALSNCQETTLHAGGVTTTTTPHLSLESSPYKTTHVDGVDVCWYQQLGDVPRGHSYFIAHEFLDALPIHQFQMTSLGWREVLVDVDTSLKSTQKQLRFVVTRSSTPATVAYTSKYRGEEGEWLEVCPLGLLCAQELAERVMSDGGVALITDYGGKKTNKNTLRSFKDHLIHDVLTEPGTADLTADVDFEALAQAASDKGAACFGPISQNEFLHKLGIRQRIEVLMKGTTPSQAKDLVTSYEMLTSPKQMGERFKFLTITSSLTHVPIPFHDKP